MSTKTQSQRLSSIKVKDTVKVVITPEFKRQIDILHKEIINREWCGVLITEDVGNIFEPDEMVITPKFIYLMNIGSGAYTEADYTAEMICDLYEKFPELEDGIWNQHMIHTHHTMTTFFSGPDKEQLEDGAKDAPYYLSLIVNCAGKYTAKVAYVVEGKETYTHKKSKKEFSYHVPGEYLVELECDIVHEETPNQVAIRTLKEETETAVKALKEKARLDCEELTAKAEGAIKELSGEDIPLEDRFMAPYNRLKTPKPVVPTQGASHHSDQSWREYDQASGQWRTPMKVSGSDKGDGHLKIGSREYEWKNGNYHAKGGGANLVPSSTQANMFTLECTYNIAGCFIFNLLTFKPMNRDNKPYKNYSKDYLEDIVTICEPKYGTMTKSEGAYAKSVLQRYISTVYSTMFHIHTNPEFEKECYRLSLSLLDEIHDVSLETGPEGYLWWLRELFEEKYDNLKNALGKFNS